MLSDIPFFQVNWYNLLKLKDFYNKKNTKLNEIFSYP